MKKELLNEWVSLSEAADILGVHPATVRNWADKGGLPAQRTPGGHRRFRRTDLHQWAATRQSPPTAETQMIIQGTLGRARMFAEHQLRDTPQYVALSEPDKEAMREKGRQLMVCLQALLTDQNQQSTLLEAARRLAVEYAQLLHASGMSLSSALNSFLYFINTLNDTVINVVELSSARMPSDWLNLLHRIREFTDTLLLGLADYYEKAGQ